MHIFKESSMTATRAYYVPKTRLKSKHFQGQFMLYGKTSIEDCCFAEDERENYYLLGMNALNFKTTFTQEQ